MKWKLPILLGLALGSALFLDSGGRLLAQDPPKEDSQGSAPQSSEGDAQVENTESPATTSGEPAAPAADSTGQTPRQPTVDEILKAFQEKERPVAEPIMPTSDAASDLSMTNRTGGEKKVRYSDGFFLTDRVGRIVKDGASFSLAFESAESPGDLSAIKLLPNRMLEMVVRETEGTADSVLFLISGEVTEFMGDNYLLIRKAIRKRDFGNLKK